MVILQNSSDRTRLIDEGIVGADQARIIRGSGVNTELFTPQSTAGRESVVLLALCILWDKGIGELVRAVRLLKCQVIDVSSSDDSCLALTRHVGFSFDTA